MRLRGARAVGGCEGGMASDGGVARVVYLSWPGSDYASRLCDPADTTPLTKCLLSSAPSHVGGNANALEAMDLEAPS